MPTSSYTSSVIMELRRLSGLNWDQLASLFNVDRTMIFKWASGLRPPSEAEEHLLRMLAVIQKADRGFACKNRIMLLDDHSGVVPVQVLARGEYERFIELVGIGPGRREVKLAPLSHDELEARRPPPPEELVGALQDSVHFDIGTTRTFKRIRS
jgi:hypothetical protein